MSIDSSKKHNFEENFLFVIISVENRGFIQVKKKYSKKISSKMSQLTYELI